MGQPEKFYLEHTLAEFQTISWASRVMQLLNYAAILMEDRTDLDYEIVMIFQMKKKFSKKMGLIAERQL